MTTSALWLEITISGFFYLLALYFYSLRSFGIYRLDFMLQGKEILPYVAIASVGISYTLGIMAHRLIQISQELFQILKRTEFESLADIKYTMESDFRWKMRRLIKVYQVGSDRLHREIDFQYSIIALLRSLTISIPACGLNLYLWLDAGDFRYYNKLTIPFTVVFTLIVIVVEKKQRRMKDTMTDVTCDEIQKYLETSHNSGSDVRSDALNTASQIQQHEKDCCK